MTELQELTAHRNASNSLVSLEPLRGLPLKSLTIHGAAPESLAPLQGTALDSLHLGAAVEHGCGLFLTNDVLLRRFPDITVELLV